MKKSSLYLILTISLMGLVSTISFAGSDSGYSKTGKSQASMMKRGMENPHFLQSQRISKLMGAEVQDRNGEKLGEVDDLITGENGRIDYLVIARGGVLGVGEDVVPVPVANISASPDKDGNFVLDVEKKVFDKAPGFAKNDWPGPDSNAWQSKARGYFGQHGDTSLDKRQDMNTNVTTDKMKNEKDKQAY